MARVYFVLVAFLFLLLSSIPYSFEARKIMKAEKLQREHFLLQDALGISTLDVLCKGCSSSKITHRSSGAATEAKVVSRLHFGMEDRNLRSVPSPGNGHFH